MSVAPPPSHPEAAPAAAERALARAVGVARVSALVILVLGGCSLLVSVRTPLTAGFAISAAVCVNGWIERRWARRLAARDRAAPSRLALNQVALGLGVLAYAAWQAHVIGPEQIDAVLRRPWIASFLAALDPEVLRPALDLLPAGVRVVYLIVGAGTFLGCCATGAWYLSLRRALRLLASAGDRASRPAGPPSETPS